MATKAEVPQNSIKDREQKCWAQAFGPTVIRPYHKPPLYDNPERISLSHIPPSITPPPRAWGHSIMPGLSSKGDLAYSYDKATDTQMAEMLVMHIIYLEVK